MKFAPAVLLVFTLSIPASAQENGLAPHQIGEIFCLGRLASDMAPVLALTTPVLATAIAYAEARSDVIQRAAPDEKPPLGDGLPWQSYPDYAAECTVGDYSSSATMSGIKIHYGFPEAPEANFTDTLVLVPVPVEPGMEPFLRIDDVVYAAGGTLRESLDASFDE
jgi:hypothetical protein